MDEIFIEETDDADNEVSEIDENLDLSFTSSKQAAYPYVMPNYDNTSDDFKTWFEEKNPEDVFDDLSYSGKQEALLDYKEREFPPKQASKDDYEIEVKDKGDGFFWVEVSKDNEHVSQGMVPASSEEEAIAYMLDKQSKVSHGESVSDYRKGLAELTIEQLEDEVYEMDQKTSALEDELEARSKTSSRTASRKRSSFDQKPLGFQRWFTKEYSDEDFDDYDEESQEGFVSEYFDSPTRHRYSKKAGKMSFNRKLSLRAEDVGEVSAKIAEALMDKYDPLDISDLFANGTDFGDETSELNNSAFAKDLLAMVTAVTDDQYLTEELEENVLDIFYDYGLFSPRYSKRLASRKQAGYKIDEWGGFNKDYDSINEIIAYMKQAFSAQDLQYLSEGFEQGADIFDIFDEEFGDAGIFLRDLREYVSDKYGEDGADADIEEAIAGLGY